MRLLPHRFWIPLLLLALAPRGPAEAQSDTWALVNARIITGTGETIPRGTIVIRDGLIAAAGSGVATPPDARVLDLDGKTVYPGMIDLASMVGLPQPRRALQRGGAQAFLTGQRDTTG